MVGKKSNCVNVGVNKGVDKMFLNKRAEAFWHVRKWLSQGGELVNKKNWEDEVHALRYKRNTA